MAGLAGIGSPPDSASSSSLEAPPPATVMTSILTPPRSVQVRMFGYYRPAGSSRASRVPAVVVVPMLGGSPLARKMMNSLCESIRSAGIAALYLDDTRSVMLEEPTPERIEAGLVAGTAEIRAALDWLSDRSEIDPDRLGGIGVSLGGIRLAAAAAVDRRLRASVIALAGADIPEIICNSSQARVRFLRDRMLADCGGNEELLLSRLRAAIRTDPVHLAAHVDARRVLMVLASFDDCVPVRNGKRLFELMGRPETVWLPTGHFGALAFAPYVQGVAMEFLKRKLSEEAPPKRTRPAPQRPPTMPGTEPGGPTLAGVSPDVGLDSHKPRNEPIVLVVEGAQLGRQSPSRGGNHGIQ
jgi:hypothetical protein